MFDKNLRPKMTMGLTCQELSSDLFEAPLPSGNQTWQWKIPKSPKHMKQMDAFCSLGKSRLKSFKF